MSMHLQQLEAGQQSASREAGLVVGRLALNANSVFILVLVLVIIPTLSGVALVA